jgi:hypothetical protein
MKQTFKRDLKRGKYHEQVILNNIKSKYKNAYIKDGYFKDYDIFVPEMNFGVEVKSDEKSKFTNNIVIEIEFNNKPSALSTTKAKYWVIYDGYDYNWFLTENIKKCILENNLRYSEFIGKGDVKSKKAYLIKKQILYKYKEL